MAMHRRSRLLRWGLLLAAIFFALGGCFGAGLTLGILRCEGQRYQDQYLKERDLIAPVLGEDPAYSRIQLWQRSNGGIYLTGDVPTAADRARLRERIIRAAGETRADEILLGVGVQPP